MKVCKAYQKARAAWKRRYAELEQRYEEAERTEQWDRAEHIGEALAEMEQHSGFKKCFSCGRKGCPAHFDGFVSWEPMDENCRIIETA
ncbi:MAG TPA: hypothetical protein DE060_11760 [Lentisphaeria bacterium]|nr:hypothetical protein [Lentisphaeria bacterium]HCG49863.1 hypothetical protein [Lentisphaeria bacterium]